MSATLQKLPTLFLVLLFALLGGCFPGVYKLDIPQGNLLEKEKVNQLKVGMNKRQVRFLLGTPLVIDSFNQDRWDYYYSHRYYMPRTNEPVDRKARLILMFEKGQLVKIDRQFPEEEAAPAELPAALSAPVEKDVPEAPEDAANP